MKTSWKTSTENHAGEGAQLITALGYLQTLKHKAKLEFAPPKMPCLLVSVAHACPTLLHGIIQLAP